MATDTLKQRLTVLAALGIILLCVVGALAALDAVSSLPLVGDVLAARADAAAAERLAAQAQADDARGDLMLHQAAAAAVVADTASTMLWQVWAGIISLLFGVLIGVMVKNYGDYRHTDNK